MLPSVFHHRGFANRAILAIPSAIFRGTANITYSSSPFRYERRSHHPRFSLRIVQSTEMCTLCNMYYSFHFTSLSRRKHGAAPAIAVYVDTLYVHWILCEEIGRGCLFRVLQEEGRGKELSCRSSITSDRRVNGGGKIVLTFTVESIDREGRERISVPVILFSNRGGGGAVAAFSASYPTQHVIQYDQRANHSINCVLLCDGPSYADEDHLIGKSVAILLTPRLTCLPGPAWNLFRPSPPFL